VATWKKSDPAIVERFGQILDRHPDVERRKMFGYPAAFVGGNMVTSLHEDSWIVRLPEAEQAEARAAGATSFDPMGGRPMKSYVVLPRPVIDDDDAVAGWVSRAIEHGRALPVKAKKK
jgi:TfoX/Sxy family transcriptional regulator of competence genes